ncbi:MAG: copper resistance protein CopC [Anaerolineaceae bacterium]
MKRVIAASLAAFLNFVLVSLAFAHSEPTNVKPGQNAVLTTAPTEVVLLMSEEMARQAGGNDVVVQDSKGAEVTKQPATIDGANRKKLSVPLPAGLLPGTYTVRWRTLSADDGDSASGNYTFTFDPNGTPSPGTETLREDIQTVITPSPDGATRVSDESVGGTSWVLVAAVGVAMFVLGAGGSFLLVQKRG